MRLNNLAKIVIAVIAGTLPVAAQQSGAAKGSLPKAQAVQNYARLPLTFEANQGQTSGQVKFLSRGNGYTAFLTTGGMVLNLRTSAKSVPNNNPSATNSTTSTTLQFRLVGANKNPQLVGENLQPGRVNYFLGKDPSQWHTNLPTYGKIRYKNVYPGIDLIYYGNHQQLEYDFAVAPGVDPRQIQFEITGASHLSLDGEGNLVLGTKAANLHFQSPLVYQESNGQRVPVAGSYVMKDSSHIGFQVPNYDASKPLVIDPVLVYSSYLGGSGTDEASGIAVDSTGSAYIAGYTDSANFPLAALGSLPTNANHVFVAKLDPTGSNLVYADYIGGNSQDYGMALVLDSADEVYVTGSTTSSDFPAVNAYQSQLPGPYSGFLTKVSADGSSVLYSTYLGGNTFDQPTSMAIDNSNEIHVAGYTMSTNFPVANAYQSTALANQGGYGEYGFLTKFSSDGSSLVYSTYFAGNTTVVQNCGSPCYPSPYNAINAVAVDTNGNAYVTGSTNTSNFPVTSGAYITSNPTQYDAPLGFVSKFGGAGNLEYSTYFYGSSGNSVSMAGIAADSTGSAYVTGTAQSDGTFPVTSTSICDPSTSGFACSYAFVTKFDPTGSSLIYSTFLGPDNYASPQAIAIDASGDAYVLASVYGGSFQATNAIESYSNQSDLLVVEIDPAASTQLFSTYLGGSGEDYPAGLAVDSDGNIYVAGSTTSSDFPTTQGSLQNQLGGGTDAFVMKIGTTSAPFVSLSPNSLQFAALAVSSTSQPQTVTLRNMGSSAMSIGSITASGDFAESDTCGSSVAAAGSCTLSITFTPTASGARTGSVVIQDDAAGSPHSIVLSGVGEGGSSSPATAVLMPSTLTFSSVPVGRSGIAQTVTLTNAGNASLSIATIQVSGDYTQTNNCGSSLTSGSSCAINVVFTPTAAGSRSGSLTIADNAPACPQAVSLTGTGAAANLMFTPASLSFSNVLVGSNSTQAVILSNAGNAPIDINSIQITGGFVQTNNCPGLLAASSSCSINIAYTPSAVATNSGSLAVSYGTQSTPLSMSVAGNGAVADLVVTPPSLAFSSVALGQSSASQTVTLTNTGNGSLSVSNLQVAGNYKQTNNCPATLAGGATCAISVVFTPNATGSSSGSLTVTDSAGNPQVVSLSGTGSDFSLATSTSSNTIQPGATATYTLTASAVGGTFSNAVSLSCSGLPAQATCSFSPSTVTPGASKVTTTLTITTTDSIADNTPAIPARRKPLNDAWMQLQGLGVVGMVLAKGKKRSKRTAIFILLALVVLGMLFMTGCAGGTGIAPQTPSTTSQSYTITVVGTSGSLQHSVPVTLIIQ
jgi:Beta-propeller repeat/Abnormal spindle-like microcephaly-assoc'd, ASPM-SPD-2-Hydin